MWNVGSNNMKLLLKKNVLNKIDKNNFFKFFSTSQKHFTSILEGYFNYNEAFSAFVKGTCQKKDTASIVGVFAKKLQKAQGSLYKNQPIKVADIGCADSVTCLQYLKKMDYRPGFDYFGIDTNQKFLQEAKIILSHEPIIKKHALVNSDALSGRLTQEKEFASALFELIFVSHTAYYIKDVLSGRRFLEDTIKLLSKKSGIAVFLHEDSTHYFRSTYNKKQFNTLSTPDLLEKSAQGLVTNSNQLKSLSFTSKLHFLPLEEDLWEAAKYPKYYKEFAHNSDFIDTLKKLAFIVQCDLIGLAESGTLTRYIDEMKDILSNNDNCFDLVTRMQILAAPQCAFYHKIAMLLKETEKEIPLILEREKTAYFEKYDSSFSVNLTF
jgi:hypothetical protein